MWKTYKRRARMAQQERDRSWRDNYRQYVRQNKKEYRDMFILIGPFLILAIILIVLISVKIKSIATIILLIFAFIVISLLILKFRFPSLFNKLLKLKRHLHKNKTFKEEVINAIKYDFPKYDKIIRDERDLENILETFLKMKFPNSNIKSQHKINDCVFDIVVDNIAIELKIGENSKKLDELFGQVEWYKDHYEDIILVILDTGAIKDIWEYKKRLESKNVSVVFVKYRFKRQQHEKFKLVKVN